MKTGDSNDRLFSTFVHALSLHACALTGAPASLMSAPAPTQSFDPAACALSAPASLMSAPAPTQSFDPAACALSKVRGAFESVGGIRVKNTLYKREDVTTILINTENDLYYMRVSIQNRGKDGSGTASDVHYFESKELAEAEMQRIQAEM